jgi:hypothetical protein
MTAKDTTDWMKEKGYYHTRWLSSEGQNHGIGIMDSVIFLL